ncbi:MULTISPECIES: LptA/OstA family protein [unclassified Sinorhizobium]|uniref:LptA/OstA family protein n=1 Tax=unclassified Sinorhizobium TaxID=2613772 RepID=UPI0024C417F0|nr:MULTISPECIES: LptA/OstA family protein [unclassified Sinorhizobium]MDK1376973.1 LptA/OstA family protein [Sinorhizobium sp. 6-70]MDK1479198.1 LptA/OstA family protein [Sinorhizobium sp. 6-117]
MSVKPAVFFRISASLAVAGLGALMIVTSASAQATSSRMRGLQLSNDKPIQIESDKLEIKDPESKAIFTGNVKVVQGTTTLQAGSMTVFYKTEGGATVTSGNADIDRIEVSNKVFLSSGAQQATGDSGLVNMTEQTLVLKGEKVVLSEGKNVFVGCQLNVQMDTGEAQLEACGGRVQIQLDPQSRKQN